MMLEKSEKFGTVLTVGPRLQKLIDADVGEDLLWGEDYPEQEKETRDGRGEFQMIREEIETDSLERVFDLWCRGENLLEYAERLLFATQEFRKVFENEKGKSCKNTTR
jgi:hypothetical protein